MSSLPDEDLEPLEPPGALIDISPEAVASGRVVVALPCVNMALSPTLDVVGFPLTDGQFGGWYVRVRDAFGTNLFSVMLKGIERDDSNSG